LKTLVVNVKTTAETTTVWFLFQDLTFLLYFLPLKKKISQKIDFTVEIHHTYTMQIGTMSCSNHYYKEYGELSEVDGTPTIDNSSDNNRDTNITSAAKLTPPTTTTMEQRLSSGRYASEISMDFSDLQGDLDGEEANSRSASGSMYPNNNKNNNIGSKESCSWHEQEQFHYQDCVQNDDDDNDNEYNKYRGISSGIHSSTLKFDEIPEDCFQQNDEDDDLPLRRQEQHQHLLTLHEQDESESERSLQINQLESCTNIEKRKVQFEASARIEEIFEFERPDNEDYHNLWYTAHELQKMIDNRRAEESMERNVVR